MAAKTCNRGHIMDSSWPECPYCKGTDGPLFVQQGDNSAEQFTTQGGTAEMNIMRNKTEFMGEEGSHGTTRVWDGIAANTQNLPVFGWLVQTDGTPGTNLGIAFTVRAGATSIGRDSKSAVVLRDELVSTQHAKIIVIDSQCFIRDADSTNGVFVNECRVEFGTQCLLKDNDVIRVGRTLFVFKGMYL